MQPCHRSFKPTPTPHLIDLSFEQDSRTVDSVETAEELEAYLRGKGAELCLTQLETCWDVQYVIKLSDIVDPTKKSLINSLKIINTSYTYFIELESDENAHVYLKEDTVRILTRNIQLSFQFSLLDQLREKRAFRLSDVY